MAQSEVSIIHISDLHISEHLLDEPDKQLKLPHRYGHNVTAFLALDKALKDLNWDALVVSGDVSRIGFRNSFFLVKNWLEGTLNYGSHQLGLNLRSSKKPYIIVPGNHDRFNENLRQGTLENYFAEFPRFQSGDVVSYALKGITFNFHLYDSTSSDGGFALGRLEQREMPPKTLSDKEVDIAVLHHHLVQPPKHVRETSTELVNSKEALAYFLSCGFDAILFGHTHNVFGDVIPAGIVSARMKDRRGKRSVWRKLVPLFFLRNRVAKNSGVAYPRESTRDGQYPMFRSYFEYLYLRDVKGLEMKAVAEFASVREFYRYMATKTVGLKQELRPLRRNRLAISMAPSACQAEEERLGFIRIEFVFKDESLRKVRFETHVFNGNIFEPRAKVTHALG